MRNVRNFWIRLAVDGRASRIETGPRRKDGGFELEILIRDKGEIAGQRLLISGKVDRDGSLIVEGHQIKTSVPTESAVLMRTER